MEALIVGIMVAVSTGVFGLLVYTWFIPAKEGCTIVDRVSYEHDTFTQRFMEIKEPMACQLTDYLRENIRRDRRKITAKLKFVSIDETTLTAWPIAIYAMSPIELYGAFQWLLDTMNIDGLIHEIRIDDFCIQDKKQAHIHEVLVQYERLSPEQITAIKDIWWLGMLRAKLLENY